MKNIIKIILSLLVVVSFNACEDSNNTIDQVVDGTTTGAILRTIEIHNNVLNSSVPTSEFSLEVEEQDEQDGALFKSVDVYVSIRDLTPSNGTTEAEALVKTIDASEFTTGPVGLPRGTIKATFEEAEVAMGLTSANHMPGDLFVFELRLNLTDGRTFGLEQASGIVTGGYFSSPYAYNTLIACSPEPGDYKIDMVDNYGDGWQGSAVRANVDGVPIDVSIPSYWDEDVATRGAVGDARWAAVSATINIPAGTVDTNWEYVAGSFPAEVEFKIYAPDGSLLGSFGPAAAPGLLPVTFCLK